MSNPRKFERIHSSYKSDIMANQLFGRCDSCEIATFIIVFTKSSYVVIIEHILDCNLPIVDHFHFTNII